MSLDNFNPDAPAAPAGRHPFNPVSIIVLCAIALSVIGLVAILSTRSHHFNNQLIALVAAIVAAAIVAFLPLEKCRRFVWPLAIAGLLLLALTLIPGIGVEHNGARRWISLGFAELQSSEIGKMIFVFVLAHYLALNQARLGGFLRGFLCPLGIIGAFAGLIALGRDLGYTALTAAVGLSLLFFAGARLRYLIPAGLLAAVSLAAAVRLMPNRFHRITSWLGFVLPDWLREPLGIPAPMPDDVYQLKQSLAAFASGGGTGAHLGQGRQKLSFLPEPHTDFILASLGEEGGLLFTLPVALLFVVIFVCGLLHLRRAPNLFQWLLVCGSLLLLSLQAFVNFGAVTGILPTKGMPLPFLSHGGSNLLLMGAIIGVLLNTRRAWSRLDPGAGFARKLTE